MRVSIPPVMCTSVVLLRAVCRAAERFRTQVLSVALMRSTNLVELLRFTQYADVFWLFL